MLAFFIFMCSDVNFSYSVVILPSFVFFFKYVGTLIFFILLLFYFKVKLQWKDNHPKMEFSEETPLLTP